MRDMVNHPSHYTSIVPGIECIQVTQHFSFLRGNAIKYLWRADAKGRKRQDLEKAIWYIKRELETLDPDEIVETLEQPYGEAVAPV